jgi:hypothetical protein
MLSELVRGHHGPARSGLPLRIDAGSTTPTNAREQQFGPRCFTATACRSGSRQWLLFPFRPHVDMPTAGTALSAPDLSSKRRHVDIVRKLRHVDQTFVSARRVEAVLNFLKRSHCSSVISSQSLCYPLSIAPIPFMLGATSCSAR